MTRALLLAACLAAGCAAHQPPSSRDTAFEEGRLAETANAYWQALRWRSTEEAAAFVEEGEARLAFIRLWSVDPPRQVTDAAVVHVDVTDPLPEDRAPRLREGTVLVRVEGYGTRSPVLGVELLEQSWYRTSEGWFLSADDAGRVVGAPAPGAAGAEPGTGPRTP